MIELSQQQADALERAVRTPLRLVNPRTQGIYVLLSADEYERLKGDEYDDTPWTRDELQAAAWEIARRVE